MVPSFTKDLKAARKPINARSETIASTGMFKAAFARRRCIVPAQAFYEWRAAQAGKEPFAIARADGDPLAFAGIWEGWRDLDGGIMRKFAIVTTSANATMAGAARADARDPGARRLDGMARRRRGRSRGAHAPCCRGSLVILARGREVGNVRNDGPHLLAPHVPPDHADRADPPGPNPS